MEKAKISINKLFDKTPAQQKGIAINRAIQDHLSTKHKTVLTEREVKRFANIKLAQEAGVKDEDIVESSLVTDAQRVKLKELQE